MVVWEEPSAHDPSNAIHINLLEFVALNVNVWLALALCLQDDPICQFHHIGNFLTDNTSALSWMGHAGRVHTPASRRLT